MENTDNSKQNTDRSKQASANKSIFNDVKSLRILVVILAAILVLGSLPLIFEDFDDIFDDDDDDNGGKEWTRDFRAEDYDFATNGSNPYFILEPGYQVILEGEDDGEMVRVEITVFNETKIVDGVNTRVVEEREFEDGEIIEISMNYFAIDTRTLSVFYFGEDVEDYEDGEIVGEEGEWLSGKDGATFGLIMPGSPILIGARYYQEYAPGVAMDRGEIKSLSETIETPKGTFQDCLFIMDSSGLESGEADPKYYAPGIGIIQDEELKLVDYGYVTV